MKSYTGALALSLLFAPQSCHAQAQDVELRMRQPVSEYTLSTQDTLEALAQVAARFQIPMGIEWVKSQPKAVSFNFKNTTVGAIIQDLVKQDSGYAINVQNGVVQIFPKEYRADRGDFLNTPVASFRVDNEFVQFASNRLRRELHEQLFPPNASAAPRSSGEAGSEATGLGDKRVTFSATQCTVRDILDKLATSAALKVWIVIYPPEKTFVGKGIIRTESAWSRDVPSDYQPSWDLLPWGLDPVTGNYRPEWLPPAGAKQ